ncbi:MAG: hypothetical protein EXR07_07645 [Acetobacteraceae bacterium]|nr:hypothetical protein [Acetobacteraceae bacterium]
MSQALQSDISPLAVFGRVLTDRVGSSYPELDPSVMNGESAWSVMKARFDEIENLKYDWDHRRSAPVPFGTLAFARQMLTSIMPPHARAPAVVPLGSGGIQLVWRTGVGELEIEVVKPNRVVAFYLDHGTCVEQEWEFSTNFRRLSDILWKINKV